MPRLLAVSTLIFLAACTCREEPKITGEVQDWWDQGVEGATVRVINDADAPQAAGAEPVGVLQTDASGHFELPVRDRWKLHVEAEGFVPRTVEFEVEGSELSHVQEIELVPVPPGPGFHMVGNEGYVPLPGQPVVRTGGELRVFHGVATVGDVEIEGDPLELVFHSPLKMEQVARLDIELHRLTFIEDMAVASVEGQSEVDLDLWVSAGIIRRCRADAAPVQLCFRWKALEDGRTYVVSADGLAPAAYAFVSMNLLDAGNEDAFEAIAPSIRKVHPFTVE